jgi:hypothetical protein
MKKIMLVLVATVMLSGCSYSSDFLAGRPMSEKQLALIITSIENGSIQKGMTYEEVENLLGPPQRKMKNVWTYYAGRVGYLSGQGQGQKWQFNFTDGKLKSIHFFSPEMWGWRNELKE